MPRLPSPGLGRNALPSRLTAAAAGHRGPDHSPAGLTPESPGTWQGQFWNLEYSYLCGVREASPWRGCHVGPLKVRKGLRGAWAPTSNDRRPGALNNTHVCRQPRAQGRDGRPPAAPGHGPACPSRPRPGRLAASLGLWPRPSSRCPPPHGASPLCVSRSLPPSYEDMGHWVQVPQIIQQDLISRPSPQSHLQRLISRVSSLGQGPGL